jgi:hypothetical protein
METNENYRPRFSFEITDEQKLRADRLINTHGLRKAIFSRILDEVLDLIDEHGPVVIGALMSPKVSPTEIIGPLSKAKKLGKKR